MVANTFERPAIELVEERPLERPRLVPGRSEDAAGLLRWSKPRSRQRLVMADALDRVFEMMLARFDVTHISVDLIARDRGLLNKFFSHLRR